jgi:hypothetical protein
VIGLVCPAINDRHALRALCANQFGPAQRGTQRLEYQFAAGGSIIAVKTLQFQHFPALSSEDFIVMITFDAIAVTLVPSDG